NGGSFAFGNATIGGTHNYSAGSFSISSGKTLTESGTLNWSGGAIAGPGTLAIGQAATMALTGGDQTLVGVPLSNAGLVTVNLGNTNALVLNGGTSFNNTSTGTLRFTAASGTNDRECTRLN